MKKTISVILLISMLMSTILSNMPIYSNDIDSDIRLEKLTPINSDRYTGNEGDSFIDILGQKNGNIDVNGNTYEYGLTAWVARYNNRNETSWVWNEYDISSYSGEYQYLLGDIVLLKSNNATTFNTKFQIVGDEKILYEVDLTPDKLPIKDVCVNLKDVKILKINLHDNKSVPAGTKFGLSNIRLSSVLEDNIPDTAIHISTPEELKNIGSNGYYILDNDIDLSLWENWFPIGTDKEHSFNGVFDGNGHEIKNLKISITSDDIVYAGLFGYVGEGAEIKNIGIVGAEIIATGSTTFVGGIVGECHGKISNCYNTGSIKSISTNQYPHAGGIVGVTYGSISDCYNTGDITALDSTKSVSHAYAGGIAGASASSLGTISRCYNSGVISISCTTDTRAYAGGIVGEMAHSALITDCYNLGNVTSSSMRSSIYATRAGGIAGYVGYFEQPTIENCYNTGVVIATSPSNSLAGGLVGEGRRLQITNCYYLDNIQHGVATGGNLTNVKALSETELGVKSSFVGFGFDTIWGMDANVNDGYPYLKVFYTQLNEHDIVEYNEHYYQVFNIGLTWQEAKVYCEKMGGHLVAITSQEEQDFVYELISNKEKDFYWLGATYDRDESNKWSWITDEVWHYSNWAPWEPNDNFGREWCLMMYREYDAENKRYYPGKWNDTISETTLYGAERYGFICEWDSIVGDHFVNLKFHSDINHNGLNANFFYSDQLFNSSSYIYNDLLAKLSLGMAMSAFSTNESEKDWAKNGNVGREDNIKYAYTKIGFTYEDTDFHNYNISLNDNSSKVAFSFAYKNIIIEGEESSIIAIIIRGGAYGSEWADNFNIGNDIAHEGFNISAKNVIDKFNLYITRLLDNGLITTTGNRKIWITGYSRGGAVANLVAGKLNRTTFETSKDLFKNEDIYTYTFATPQGIRTNGIENPSDELFNNIINIVFPLDVVPRVPLSNWNFGRYGITYMLPYYKYNEFGADVQYKVITGIYYPLTDMEYINPGIVEHLIEILYDIIPNSAYVPLYYEDMINEIFHIVNYRTEDNKTIEDIGIVNIWRDIYKDKTGELEKIDKSLEKAKNELSTFWINGSNSTKYSIIYGILEIVDIFKNIKEIEEFLIPILAISVYKYGTITNFIDLIERLLKEGDITPKVIIVLACVIVYGEDYLDTLPPDILSSVKTICEKLSKIVVLNDTFLQKPFKNIGSNFIIAMCIEILKSTPYLTYLTISNENINSANLLIKTALAIPYAHQHEIYLSWMLAHNYTNGFPHGVVKNVIVECPVDVNIYDSNGKLMASVINEEITKNIFPVTVSNGKKVISLYNENDFYDEFNVEIIARENGTMNYSIIEYDMNMLPVRKTLFNDIVLNEGQAYNGKINMGSGVPINDYSLSTSYNGMNYDILPDEEITNKNDLQVIVNVTSNEYGYVYGNQMVTRGEKVAVTAVPNEECMFDGWYINNELIPNAGEIYSFMATENVTLEARFINQSELSPNEIKITTETLPNGKVGAEYNSKIDVVGDGDITYEITSGQLPNGLNIDSVTGKITGIPELAGIFEFTIQATNDSEISDNKTFDITVQAVEIDTYIAVSEINNVPNSMTVGDTLMLTGSVLPSSATNQTIIWSIENAGNTGAKLNDNKLTATSAGTVTVKATIGNGLTKTTNYEQTFDIAVQAIEVDTYIAVSEINNVPTSMTVGDTLELTGKVLPSNATNQTIKWSIANAGNTGAKLNNDVLTATSAGAVKVKANIENGLTKTTDYEQIFNITVQAEETDTYIAVSEINNVPSSMTVGDTLMLTGSVLPSSATNQTIKWSIANAGNTGAELNNYVLTVTSAGTIKVRATIENGLTKTTDYEQIFDITVQAVEIDTYIAVSEINNVPSSMTVGEELTLTGSVLPSEATNQTIKWSIANAGNTGAKLNNDVLTATSAGTITVRATIENGLTKVTDYTEIFEITVNAKDITPIPEDIETEKKIIANEIKFILPIFETSGHKIMFKNTGDTSIPYQIIKHSSSVIKPNDPVMDGYTFVGWYYDENYLVKYNFESRVTKDIILYAKWIKN